MTEGKIQVVVRSRVVPSTTVLVTKPQITPAGVWFGKDVTRKLVFQPTLDDEHQRVVDEGRRLAKEMDLELEIIDEAKANPLRRVFRFLGRGPSSPPKLVITPAACSFGGAALGGTVRTAC